jgi:hypothetical protein
MIFPCRLIVRLCGVDFGVEGADVYFFVFMSDSAFPFAIYLPKPYADEFRGGIFSFAPVLHIL